MKRDAGLLSAIQTTAEVIGEPLSREALVMMVADLDDYDDHQVIAALRLVRRECRGRLTLADIIARIDDGRPGPEEAWSMVQVGEQDTLVWTDEVRTAYGAASPLLADGDAVAARMAFLEVYRREVRTARAESRPVRWTASLGHDAAGRERAVADGVERGLIEWESVPALPGPYDRDEVCEATQTKIREAIAACREALTGAGSQRRADRASSAAEFEQRRAESLRALAKEQERLKQEAQGRYPAPSGRSGSGSRD